MIWSYVYHTAIYITPTYPLVTTSSGERAVCDEYLPHNQKAREEVVRSGYVRVMYMQYGTYDYIHESIKK